MNYVYLLKNNKLSQRCFKFLIITMSVGVLFCVTFYSHYIKFTHLTKYKISFVKHPIDAMFAQTNIFLQLHKL